MEKFNSSFARAAGPVVLLLLLAWSTTSFAIPTPTGQRLKDLGAQLNLLIGGSSDLNHRDANEEAIAVNEYSILCNENCLKPYSTEPSQGNFSFRQPDYMMAFCRDNDITGKGHTLLGRDFYTPNWMKSGSRSQEQWRELIWNHISNVMGRYKKGSQYGEIKYWDVVNEVLNEGYPCALRNMGKNDDGDYLFIEEAFHAARATDSSCMLIWNEDNMEYYTNNVDNLLGKIRRYKARGVPIDAVGFQCHIAYLPGTGAPDYDKLAASFKKCSDMGLYIVVSEMDVPSSLNQPEVYSRVLETCLDNPYCIIFDTWNIVDRYSWRGGSMLLFNNSYEAKPAYYALQETLEAYIAAGGRQAVGSRIGMKPAAFTPQHDIRLLHQGDRTAITPSFRGEYTAVVHDQAGRVCWKGAGSDANACSLPQSKLPQGVYLLRVSGENRSVSRRIWFTGGSWK